MSVQWSKCMMEGGSISSTLEAMKRHVTATNWSWDREMTQVERKWSMMLTVRKSVSRIRWKQTWTWMSQSIRTLHAVQLSSFWPSIYVGLGIVIFQWYYQIKCNDICKYAPRGILSDWRSQLHINWQKDHPGLQHWSHEHQQHSLLGDGHGCNGWLGDGGGG